MDDEWPVGEIFLYIIFVLFFIFSHFKCRFDVIDDLDVELRRRATSARHVEMMAGIKVHGKSLQLVLNSTRRGGAWRPATHSQQASQATRIIDELDDDGTPAGRRHWFEHRLADLFAALFPARSYMAAVMRAVCVRSTNARRRQVLEVSCYFLFLVTLRCTFLIFDRKLEKRRRRATRFLGSVFEPSKR